MRSKIHAIDPRSNKYHSKNTNSSVTDAIKNVIIPIAKKSKPAKYTSFSFDETESLRNTMTQIKRDCPFMIKSRKSFFEEIERVYDEVVCNCRGG